MFFSFCSIAQATNVSGVISTNTTWDTARSPYIVTGNNLLVDTQTTLTIQPGVMVKLDSAQCIMVKGTLNAVGSATDSIIITKNGAQEWSRLWFKSSSVCSLKFCRIEYANSTAIYGDTVGSITIEHCTIADNVGNDQPATTGGGIMVNGGAIDISGTTITGNVSHIGYAAAIAIFANTLAAVTGNVITNNWADGYGGAILCGSDSVTIVDNIISNNSGGLGGGITILSGFVSITNNTITNNRADGPYTWSQGGGIYNNADIAINGNTITNNWARHNGGAIYNNGTATLRHNTMTYNMADSFGGTIYNSKFLSLNYNSIIDTSTFKLDTGFSTAIYNDIGTIFMRTNDIRAVRHLMYNNTPNNIDARYNFWNTANIDTINARVFDYFDDFSKGIITFVPFLKAPFSDTTAPPAPLHLIATHTKDSSFVITWANPSDASGIAEYYYKLISPPTYPFDTTGTFHTSPDTLLSQGGLLYVWLVDSSGNMNYQNTDSVLLNISAIRTKGKAFGNPTFSLTTRPSSSGAIINYGIPEETLVNLTLYDISGRLVKRIYSGIRESGYYTVDLGKNEITSGGYFIRIKTANCTATTKLVLLR
jgi:hypothetical protein